MTQDEPVGMIRIGGPPQGPLVRPNRRWPLFAAAGAVFVLVVAGATAAGIAVARSDNHAADMAAAWTMPSFSPSPIPLSEQAACNALVPLIGDALQDINAMVAKPDGSTVQWDRLNRTIAGFQATLPGAPADMRGDIQAQMNPLVQLAGLHEGTATDQHFELDGYREAGLRLLNRCKVYAHG